MFGFYVAILIYKYAIKNNDGFATKLGKII